MPAHNEGAGIGDACRAARAQLVEKDRFLVVADNCSDDTSAIARSAGAEVIERHDNSKLGKSYALEFGVRHLATSPPDVLVVVDADCTLADGSLEHLSRACIATGRPVQAIYWMRSRPGANLKVRIAGFAGVVKNFARPLGYHRLGLPCMLMGTGMAFPWPVIQRADLATGHIVEDMKLGLDLARKGSPPVLCPEAEIASYFPDTTHGFRSQRTRWEHGHIALIAAEAPGLIWHALKERDGALLAMAVDLSVPPLALLALLVVTACGAAVVLAVASGQMRPLWAAATISMLLFISILVAWWRFARTVISLRELAFAPLYAVSKIPIYIRYLYRRQVDWVRSARKGE
jgi:cellulose synthase/poly-beta-1,6-N-acetylglucosamine synthase-like glycosyltransferase